MEAAGGGSSNTGGSYAEQAVWNPVSGVGDPDACNIPGWRPARRAIRARGWEIGNEAAGGRFVASEACCELLRVMAREHSPITERQGGLTQLGPAGGPRAQSRPSGAGSRLLLSTGPTDNVQHGMKHIEPSTSHPQMLSNDSRLVGFGAQALYHWNYTSRPLYTKMLIYSAVPSAKFQSRASKSSQTLPCPIRVCPGSKIPPLFSKDFTSYLLSAPPTAPRSITLQVPLGNRCTGDEL